MRLATERRTQSRARRWRVVLTVSTAILIGCAADIILAMTGDSRSQTISAAVGQEIDVTLGNVGPALYVSPPLMSSAVAEYLGVDVVPPFAPGGPTQRFRFKAVGAGQALVEFRRTLGDSVVSVVRDTFQVR